MAIGTAIGIPFKKSGQSWSSYWTRPFLEGGYGTGDGKSYANAFNGFDDIEWAQVAASGKPLMICGEHLETLTVGAGGTAEFPLVINFSYPADKGSINGGDSLLVCLDTNNYDNITIVGDITNKTLYDAITSCLYVGATSTGIIVNYIWADGSGNQAFQNEGAPGSGLPNVVYNFCKGTGSADDGISLHEGTVICNDCEFSGNNQGFNNINNSIITFNRCSFLNNTTDEIHIGGTTVVICNDCKVSGTRVLVSGTSSLTMNNCAIKSTLVSCSATNTLVLNECYIYDVTIMQSYGALTLNRCYFEGAHTTTNWITTVTAGNLTVNYTVFKSAVNIYCISHDSSGTFVANNCSFVGVSNTGRGIIVLKSGTVNNCLFNDLKNDVVISGAGETLTLNKCNRYDITTQKYVFAGTITDNDPVANSPNLVDVANDNFSLGAGSSCIGSGADQGSSPNEGIASAIWSNGSVIPVVVSKNQAAAWDIGAYIH